MSEKTFSDDELRERLTPEQYAVTQQAGTEGAFTGVYWDCHDTGTYRCVVCDTALFDSDDQIRVRHGLAQLLPGGGRRRRRRAQRHLPRHGPHRGGLRHLRRPPRSCVR